MTQGFEEWLQVEIVIFKKDETAIFAGEDSLRASEPGIGQISRHNCLAGVAATARQQGQIRCPREGGPGNPEAQRVHEVGLHGRDGHWRLALITGVRNVPGKTLAVVDHCLASD